MTRWLDDMVALNSRVKELEAEVTRGEEACRAHVCLGSQEMRAERDALKAQVEAARKACEKRLRGTYATLSKATARQILDAMDEAAKCPEDGKPDSRDCDCRLGCVNCNPWLW